MNDFWNLTKKKTTLSFVLKLPVFLCLFSRHFLALFPVTSAIIFLNLKIWMSANKNSLVHLQAPVFVPIESAKKLQLLPNWHIFRLKTPTANCLEEGMLFIGIVIQ